jgi:hypothetical protein
LTPDETARRNGWTPERLAAYQAERDAAFEVNLEMRLHPGSTRSIRTAMAGTFPRMRFVATAPKVDANYSYLKGRR